MLPVGGTPILEHLVSLLRNHGIDEIAINLHYKPEVITQHFGDGQRLGVHLTYSPEAALLGSAGAAKQLDWFLTDTFVVLYGDVLTDLDLTALIDRHRARRGVGTVVLYEVDDPSRCGIVELSAEGRIDRFVEKPPPESQLGNLANAGIYVLEPEVLRSVPTGQPSDFGLHLFPRLLERGLALYGYRTSDYVLDIGSPERYAQAETDLQTGRFQPGGAAAPRRWYVARSRPRAEWLAAAAIEARGLFTWLPEWRQRGTPKKAHREPLFPGYLFVRTDGRSDALLRARSAPNVVRLLGSEAGPEAVPDELVEEIRSRCEQQHREPFVAGQKVRIAHGPFRELDAVFDAEYSGGARARVFIQLLNRLVPVILEMNLLRRAV
jgi:dTDP-glucose pyrophosphorylase